MAVKPAVLFHQARQLNSKQQARWPGFTISLTYFPACSPPQSVQQPYSCTRKYHTKLRCARLAPTCCCVNQCVSQSLQLSHTAFMQGKGQEAAGSSDRTRLGMTRDHESSFRPELNSMSYKATKDDQPAIPSSAPSGSCLELQI